MYYKKNITIFYWYEEPVTMKNTHEEYSSFRDYKNIYIYFRTTNYPSNTYIFSDYFFFILKKRKEKLLNSTSFWQSSNLSLTTDSFSYNIFFKFLFFLFVIFSTDMTDRPDFILTFFIIFNANIYLPHFFLLHFCFYLKPFFLITIAL